MNSLTPWIVISYFVPFCAFFFGIFFFGLNIWVFVLGTFIVSVMSLVLFLMAKHSQYITQAKAQKHILQKEKKQARPIPSHPLTGQIHKLLQKPPTIAIQLCEKQSLETLIDEHRELKMEHEKIVEAYEHEREKLFAELKELKAANEAEIAKLLEKEKEAKGLSEQIKSLTFELDTLLKIDPENLLLEDLSLDISFDMPNEQ